MRVCCSLTQEALVDIGGPDSKAGIFVLTAAETDTLRATHGGFTPAEAEHLRPVINTRNVFPYGVVLPAEPSHLIWLPAAHGGPGGAFPADMPAFEAHLRRFKPLLEATVTKYKVNRPWWSAHNPRTHLVEGHPATGHWADLAVTARWGDRKLVTALAPAQALPLSGLHAMTGQPGTTAAYLVGLINSTPIQDLAAALAPGSVGQDDIEHLGLPQFGPDDTQAIERHVRSIADTVHALVTEHGRTWPLLPDTLRADITLAEDITHAWHPAPRARGWGTLNSVAWTRITTTPRISGVVESTEITDTLLGRLLTLHFTRGTMHLEVDDHGDRDMRDLVRALVLGAGRAGPAQIRATPVPLQVDTLAALYGQDLTALRARIDRYRALRQEIDDIVTAALGG
jgi:hypothetical protein